LFICGGISLTGTIIAQRGGDKNIGVFLFGIGSFFMGIGFIVGMKKFDDFIQKGCLGILGLFFLLSTPYLVAQELIKPDQIAPDFSNLRDTTNFTSGYIKVYTTKETKGVRRYVTLEGIYAKDKDEIEWRFVIDDSVIVKINTDTSFVVDDKGNHYQVYASAYGKLVTRFSIYSPKPPAEIQWLELNLYEVPERLIFWDIAMDFPCYKVLLYDTSYRDTELKCYDE
jgi:hypothetical protein